MGNYKHNESMKIMTISMPKIYLDIIIKAVEMGIFPSKSAAIRYCVISGIGQVLEDIQTAKLFLGSKEDLNLAEFLRERGFKVVKISNKKIGKEGLGNPFWKLVKTKDGEIIRIPKSDEEILEMARQKQ